MKTYVYPAVFTAEEEGGYSVRFPDLEGCYTQGETAEEAFEMAKDVLCLTLYGLEEDGEPINPPSDIRSLELAGNEFSSLVDCDTMEYRRYFESKSVKKTLTIPSWLNARSEKAHINFSAVLQKALMQELNIEQH
ncbi:MAG: type II toxin-antitoxin system HicB family antitoxin [Ruminococcus sp.]|nr:type II toxin-antitoxin system HicB family antitoxin [Ruminococcus sp.]